MKSSRQDPASIAQSRTVHPGEALLREVLRQIPHRIFVKQSDGRFVLANDALAAELGRTPEALVGAHQRDVSPNPEDGEKVLEADREVIRTGQAVVIDEEWFTDAAGERRSYQTTKLPIVDPETAEPLVLGVAIDVTARKEAERQLRASERRFRAAFDGAPIGLALVSRGLRVFQVNRVLMTMLSQPLFESSELDLLDLIHEEDRVHAERELEPLVSQRRAYVQFEARLAGEGGATVWGLLTGSVVSDEAGDVDYLILQVQDVSEARELSRELTYQASHDDLTGLVNRRECEQRLQRLIDSARSRGNQHAFCYLDLDQFKVVNDTHGHAAGDRLLSLLGHRLKQCTRGRDTIARLGGDEFAVLLENCDLADAERRANSLIAAVRDFRCPWGDHVLRVGASAGLVSINERSESVEAVLRAADVACFTAKDRGRDRLYTYRSSDVEVSRQRGEMRWVGRIHLALDEDRFELMSQPIVSLAEEGPDRKVELLVRMRNEDGTVTEPGAFLPAAERYGLAGRIDRWVVGRVLSLLREDAPCLRPYESIGINLSGQSLGDAVFVRWLGEAMAENSGICSRLCFEITETAAIRDMAGAKALIDLLSDLGCEFALDDFGSGLSSFGYLRSLPVAFVKVDGLFVRNMVSDPIDHAMVRSICDVARLMGKRTVAEGVENDDALESLRALGVDFAQGFGIGAPAPLDP